jgi:hypothetical protein
MARSRLKFTFSYTRKVAAHLAVKGLGIAMEDES